MAKRTRAADQFDSPWKDALQLYLPAFLTFFFTDIHADIDWPRGYESLDKEFQKIARRAKVGKRIADKLFKVWLKDGREHWLLVHVEIQGDVEEEFARRMFEYNAAARQLYNNDVVSLAVLCDERGEWRPTTFAYGRWGCEMRLTFRSAKLLDFADQVEMLEASDNLFAAVVLAHCKAIETRGAPLSRRDWKLRIVKGLYRRGWSMEDVRRLFLVIDWIMALPDDLEAAFAAQMEEYAEEHNVRYVSSIERLGFERGEESGRRKEAVAMISLMLDDKFGAPGLRLLRKVRALDDLSALRKFARFLRKAKSMDDVRTYFE